MRNQICAVITTYRPKPFFVQCIKRVLPQVGKIIIVDDGESKNNVVLLNKWFKDEKNVIFLHQLVNSGIASALNYGIKIAKDNNYEWVLTLDDDSFINLDMVECLCKYLDQIKGNKPIGLIGMKWSTQNYSTRDRKKLSSKKFLDKRGIITSGSLFSMSTYSAVGPFREEFFIDSVDYDFCMRARSKGFRVIQVQEYGFKHSLGRNEIFKLGEIKIINTSHSPDRLYYTFRNTNILAREYFLSDPLFSIALIISQLRTILKIIFLQNNKRIKLIYILRGIVAAFNRKMGKLEFL